MGFKLPVYSGIHKGQRRWLADISSRAGRTDYSKKDEVEKLIQEVKAFKEHLSEHADLEQRFIHPTVKGLLPGVPRMIEAEHVSLHQDLEELVHSGERIQDMPREHETLSMVGHEFYLALNRFIYIYLKHIDFEEDHVQQILLNDLTGDELMGMFMNIVNAQSPESLRSNLRLIILGSNVPEIIGLLKMGKAIVPPDVYDDMINHARESLEPQKWSTIQMALSKQ